MQICVRICSIQAQYQRNWLGPLSQSCIIIQSCISVVQRFGPLHTTAGRSSWCIPVLGLLRRTNLAGIFICRDWTDRKELLIYFGIVFVFKQIHLKGHSTHFTHKVQFSAVQPVKTVTGSGGSFPKFKEKKTSGCHPGFLGFSLRLLFNTRMCYKVKGRYERSERRGDQGRTNESCTNEMHFPHLGKSAIIGHVSALKMAMLVQQFGPNWNISSTGWTARAFLTDIHGPQMVYPRVFLYCTTMRVCF